MSRSSDSFGSANGEWDTITGQETDQSGSKDSDDQDQVDLLINNYSETLKVIEHATDLSRADREKHQFEAQEFLIQRINSLPNPMRAMRKIRHLLGETLTVDSDETIQGSNVEVIEDFGDREVIRENPQANQQAPERAMLSLVQLFDIDEEGRTVFNQAVLDSLCAQIGDLPVSIISTAGKFRQGKTFWNNVLLKGLQDGKASFMPNDCIGGQGGIQFQNGYNRHTKGIMVWPEVFFRKDKQGKEIAVILMDTQGTYDTSCDTTDSVIIFSISLLMSSIQIFNLRTRLDAQDLDSLSLFLAFNQRTDERIGQQFIFLIRDALEFGRQPRYLCEVQRQTQRSSELKTQLESIYGAFEHVDCYMARTPTNHVQQASGEIMAEDCGEGFLGDLCLCANDTLENLVPKRIMGTELTGRTLRQHVENLVTCVQTNSARGISSAFQATSQLYFEQAKTAANEYFASEHDLLVRKHGHRPIDSKVYEEALKHSIEGALKVYNSKPLFGSKDEKNRVLETFIRFLEEKCAERELNNRCRFRDLRMADATEESLNLYESRMKPDLQATLMGTRDVESVRQLHERALSEAMERFENAVESFNDEIELVGYKRKLLMDTIMARFKDLQKDNMTGQLKQNLRKNVGVLVDSYGELLKDQISKVKKLNDIKDHIALAQTNFENTCKISKAEFVNESRILMPDLGEDLLHRMFDNHKETQAPSFKRWEDDFEREVGHRLGIEKIQMKFQDYRSKQQQDQRKRQEETKRTEETLNALKEQLASETQRRETAEQSGSIHPMMLLIKQMNEQTQRQIDQSLEEKEQRRRDQISRERADREERALNLKISQMGIDANLTNDMANREAERDQRIRDEAAAKMRATEERRQKEQEKADRGVFTRIKDYWW